MRLTLWALVLGTAGASLWNARRHQLKVRVRSTLPRSALSPDAIRVRMPRKGLVALSGDVLAGERAPVIEAARGIPGVTGVEDGLVVHHNSQGMPVHRLD